MPIFTFACGSPAGHRDQRAAHTFTIIPNCRRLNKAATSGSNLADHPLVPEAIGLGGWMGCGILSREIFEALGFTIVEAQEGLGLPNPVGLDRVFQAYCPPYFESMDAAVDAALKPLLREQSTPIAAGGSPVPYLISSDDHRNGAVAVSEEGIACTKAVCNYIYQTYGRFPGTVDAMHLMWLMQAHHLDTNYYDRFFRPGAYGSTHAPHLRKWHP